MTRRDSMNLIHLGSKRVKKKLTAIRKSPGALAAHRIDPQRARATRLLLQYDADVAAVLAGSVGDESLDFVRRRLAPRYVRDVSQPVARHAVFDADGKVAGFLPLKGRVPIANYRQLGWRLVDHSEPLALDHAGNRLGAGIRGVGVASRTKAQRQTCDQRRHQRKNPKRPSSPEARLCVHTITSPSSVLNR
jgi:hypothetical protein